MIDVVVMYVFILPYFTNSCLIKIQNDFTFLILAYSGCPGNKAIQWVFLYATRFQSLVLLFLILYDLFQIGSHFGVTVFAVLIIGNCCDDKELRMEYDEIATDTPPPQLIAEHESLLGDGLSVELTASQVAKSAVLPTVSCSFLCHSSDIC